MPNITSLYWPEMLYDSLSFVQPSLGICRGFLSVQYSIVICRHSSSAFTIPGEHIVLFSEQIKYSHLTQRC